MHDAVTYGIELAVGVATLVLALAVARTGRRWWLAAIFAVAGLAASIHAVAELAT